MDDLVAFRAVFERFPVSIKGAFVLRGADGLPHQVRIERAVLGECAGRAAQAIAIDPAIIEVAPTLDTFVPFEVPTLELGPGWYQLRCDVQVDGVPDVIRPGDRMSIAWPRSAVRRGSVRLDEKAGEVLLVSLDCLGDTVRIPYVAGDPPSVRLTVDGTAHPVLQVEHDEEAGAGKIVGYPVLRQHERLGIEVRGQDPVEVDLP
ncbi:MAG TPA: hypothetical protein VIB62_06645 [Actinomycetota bacterium]|jgi:hypothetical protein